jgi:hypothetical protein
MKGDRSVVLVLVALVVALLACKSTRANKNDDIAACNASGGYWKEGGCNDSGHCAKSTGMTDDGDELDSEEEAEADD